MHRPFALLQLISAALIAFAMTADRTSAQADFSANQMIVPASVNAGGVLNFTYSVTNIGFPPTPPMSFSVYLSTNSTISTGDTFVQTVSNAAVGNGQSASVTIPSSVAQGTWFIGFIVAPASGETFTANNVLSVPPSINILPPAPDLQAVSISGPTAVVRSQVVTLTRNIANIGGPAQSGPLSYDVVLSTNNTYEPTDTLLAAASSNTLGSLTINVTIPSNQAAGNYFYILRVLPYTGETITTNNNIASVAQVAVVVANPTVTSLSPATGPTGGGTLVTVNGTNFVGTPAVTFNGASATNITFVSPTQITCTTPANPIGQPTNATVAVTTSNGSGSLANGFNFGEPQPGTGEQFVLLTGVNGPANNAPVKQATAGNTLAIAFNSPNNQFVGSAPVLVAQVFQNQFPPLGIGAYPSIHVDPGLAVIVFNGASMPGGFVLPLPVGGLQFLYSVPAGLVGFTLRVQALAVTPTAANGFFAATNAHDFVFF